MCLAIPNPTKPLNRHNMSKIHPQRIVFERAPIQSTCSIQEEQIAIIVASHQVWPTCSRRKRARAVHYDRQKRKSGECARKNVLRSIKTRQILILVTNGCASQLTQRRETCTQDTPEEADHVGALQTGHGTVCLHLQPIAKTRSELQREPTSFPLVQKKL